MINNKNTIGHLSALVTIFLWGTTYISTKILLRDFSPIDILFFRFVIGFLILFIIYPHKLKIKEKKQEYYFALAGLFGVTLFFLFENFALTFSTASNIGVIVCISPFFTAIFAHFLLKNEKLKPQFFLGFVISIFGVFLISFNGSSVLKLNPLGDILAVCAAVLWSSYSIVTKKISSFNYNIIQTTRRVFFYGLLFMIPALFIFDFNLGLDRFLKPINLLNIIYLGFGASALCFLTWNFAIKILGVTKTSVYIYAVPVITIVTAAIILGEKPTLVSLVGAVFALLGLYVAQRKL